MTGLLIDENLPASLAERLGVVCHHASAMGEQITDLELWLQARRHGWAILTKDADFFEHLVVQGAPPQIIWVRTGNLRRAALEALLVDRWARIAELLTKADLIEVHADRLEAFKFPAGADSI